MSAFTRDQVQKLTPEQQEALGDMEARRIRSRQQLLERARHGMGINAGLLMGLAGGLAILCTAIPRALPFAIIAVIWLVTFHARRLHRRLDALMGVLDEDIKKPPIGRVMMTMPPDHARREWHGKPVLPVAQGTAGTQDRGRLEKGWCLKRLAEGLSIVRTTQISLQLRVRFCHN